MSEMTAPERPVADLTLDELRKVQLLRDDSQTIVNAIDALLWRTQAMLETLQDPQLSQPARGAAERSAWRSLGLARDSVVGLWTILKPEFERAAGAADQEIARRGARRSRKVEHGWH
jgi:hypothetical protein